MKRSVALMLLAACGGTDEPEGPPCDPTEVGTICTIAGAGKSGYSGDDGPAFKAQMSLPQDMLKLGDDLMILDWNNHRVRKLEADGTMRHVAGRGELGGTLDDPANSDLNHPTGLLYDAANDRLVIAAWHNSKLRAIDMSTLEITDECGDGRRAYFGDGGPAKTAALDLPASIAYSPTGDLIIMDQANQVMRKVDAAGNISRFAGKCVVSAMPPLGMGVCAAGEQPIACAAPSGKFVCGGLAACALPCTPGFSDDSLLEFRMAQPFGQSADPAGRIAFDAAGDLFFADTTNGLIRKIDAQGAVSVVAGTPPVDGVPQTGYSGDGGLATDAKLFNPVDLAFDTDGTLYFSDVYNHCVREIFTNGAINTVAGTCGTQGYDGDGGNPLNATLKRPYGIEVADGVLYIADTGNNVIRSIKLR